MHPLATKVIQNPQQVTAEWLTARLRANGILDAGEVIAVGFDDRTKPDRVANRIRVRYSENAPADAPRSLSYRFNNNGAARVDDKRLCGAVREARFYTQMAPQTNPRPVAQLYDAGIHEQTGETYLLLEDLNGTHELAHKSDTPSPYGGGACFDTLPRVSWEAQDLCFIRSIMAAFEAWQCEERL